MDELTVGVLIVGVIVALIGLKQIPKLFVQNKTVLPKYTRPELPSSSTPQLPDFENYTPEAERWK